MAGLVRTLTRSAPLKIFFTYKGGNSLQRWILIKVYFFVLFLRGKIAKIKSLITKTSKCQTYMWTKQKDFHNFSQSDIFHHKRTIAKWIVREQNLWQIKTAIEEKTCWPDAFQLSRWSTVQHTELFSKKLFVYRVTRLQASINTLTHQKSTELENNFMVVVVGGGVSFG